MSDKGYEIMDLVNLDIGVNGGGKYSSNIICYCGVDMECDCDIDDGCHVNEMDCYYKMGNR